MKRLGSYLPALAIAVHAPRLILAYLDAEGVVVATAWRTGMLTLAAVATGIVLTGGSAYLAHSLPGLVRHRRLVAVCWVTILVTTGGLLAPLVVGSLSHRELDEVLTSPAARWSWALGAVLCVELVAGAGMLAHAAERARGQRLDELDQQLVQLAGERNELESELGRLGHELVQVVEQRDDLQRQLELADEPEPEAEGLEVSCRNGCGWVGASTRAEAGHQRACPLRA